MNGNAGVSNAAAANGVVNGNGAVSESFMYNNNQMVPGKKGVDPREDSSTPVARRSRATGMAMFDRGQMAQLGEDDDDDEHHHGSGRRKGVLNLFCCRA